MILLMKREKIFESITIPSYAIKKAEEGQSYLIYGSDGESEMVVAENVREAISLSKIEEPERVEPQFMGQYSIIEQDILEKIEPDVPEACNENNPEATESTDTPEGNEEEVNSEETAEEPAAEEPPQAPEAATENDAPAEEQAAEG